MDLKETIKQFTKEKGMTFKELAELAGLNRAGLHDKFRRGSITVRDLEKLLDVLGKEMTFKDKEQK